MTDQRERLREADGLIFERECRGYTVRPLAEPQDRDALIEIRKGGEIVRSFRYPTYRVYNIAAHFEDIVDDLEEAPDGR